MKQYKFKITGNKSGMAFIKLAIKSSTDKRLYGILGVAEKYSDSDEKKEIIELLKEEFNKRGLPYV